MWGAWILAILKNPVVVFSAIKEIISIVHAVQDLFRKSPVEQQADAEKAHDKAAIDAEKSDDTSGLFGGSK